MSSESYHEPLDVLTPKTRDLHRAISSLMEELEAVDWYQQRVDASGDPELAAILAHNRDEEIEHAMMVLEWIRRRVPKFDEDARTYLFSEGAITEVEAVAAHGSEASGKGEKKSETEGKSAPSAGASLGIGSLKGATR